MPFLHPCGRARPPWPTPVIRRESSPPDFFLILLILPQHRHLCRGQRHFAFRGLRPREMAALQNLVVKADPPLAPLALGPMAIQWLTQCKIFSLSPIRPRNTKTAPLAGSSSNDRFARAQRPEIPPRMSVMPAARKTRTPFPGPIIRLPEPGSVVKGLPVKAPRSRANAAHSPARSRPLSESEQAWRPPPKSPPAESPDPTTGSRPAAGTRHATARYAAASDHAAAHPRPPSLRADQPRPGSIASQCPTIAVAVLHPS